MSDDTITNEDWYVEYISVIFRTLNEMLRIPISHDLSTFAKDWTALPASVRNMDVLRASNGNAHIIRTTIHPVDSVVFEYNPDDDFSIFGSVEEVDSYFSYDTAYTYYDLLAVVMDAAIKLLSLTDVSVDPRLYSGAKLLTDIYENLLALARESRPLSSHAMTSLANAFLAFETFISESNEEAEEVEE